MRLPFKTSPKEYEIVTIGGETIGTLEIKKLGDLSPNERIFIEGVMKDYPDMRTAAARMARNVSQKSGMKLLDVYNALKVGDMEVLGDYLDEFVEFQEMMERVTQKRQLALSTAIIKYRLAPDWSIEDTGNPDLIPTQLVTAIAEFALKEESKWDVVEEVSEEDLGKLKKLQAA